MAPEGFKGNEGGSRSTGSDVEAMFFRTVVRANTLRKEREKKPTPGFKDALEDLELVERLQKHAQTRGNARPGVDHVDLGALFEVHRAARSAHGDGEVNKASAARVSDHTRTQVSSAFGALRLGGDWPEDPGSEEEVLRGYAE